MLCTILKKILEAATYHQSHKTSTADEVRMNLQAMFSSGFLQIPVLFVSFVQTLDAI